MRRPPIHALLLLLPGVLLAQEPEQKPAEERKPVEYFPTEVGRSWTYLLKLKDKREETEVFVTTKVERTEAVKDAGICAVFVSSSKDKLLNTTWYSTAGGKLSNPRYKGGKPRDVALNFTGRTLLDPAVLEKFTGKEPPEKKPRWEWTCSDGSSGQVVLDRRERIYLPKIGDLRDCLVIVDTANYYSGKGDERKLVRVYVRTLWLARGRGLVKETLRVLMPDKKTVRFQTEATLTKYQEP